MFKNKSLHISAPKDKTLHGVRIRKLPIAKYIAVLRAAEELPQIIVGKAFEGKSLSEVALYLKSLDKDTFLDLLTRLFAVVPEELAKLISELLDIPIERLLEDDDNALGLTELAEILSAFWDANDMTSFFETARQLTGKIKSTANTGSNVGSPSRKASEYLGLS